MLSLRPAVLGFLCSGLLGRVTPMVADIRVGKASAYEGGVRVPMIVHWPGITKPASVCDEPIMTYALDFVLKTNAS